MVEGAAEMRCAGRGAGRNFPVHFHQHIPLSVLLLVWQRGAGDCGGRRGARSTRCGLWTVDCTAAPGSQVSLDSARHKPQRQTTETRGDWGHEMEVQCRAARRDKVGSVDLRRWLKFDREPCRRQGETSIRQTTTDGHGFRPHRHVETLAIRSSQPGLASPPASRARLTAVEEREKSADGVLMRWPCTLHASTSAIVAH